MSVTLRSQNPYIGPRAFQDGETLYGRDRELSKLLNLLIAERIVLLYSPSGAGKTSLIQAALMPALREEGFRVLPVIRVGMEPPLEIELPSTSNRYLLSTLLSLEEELPPEQQTPFAELAKMDLTGYLDPRLADDTEADGDVLIFDQFEEILSVDPTDQKAKTEFFVQLGKALRSRDRWALFAMREEYPAGLDPYLRPIPTRLNTTFRLELLGTNAAREAMQEPAHQAGVPFTDSAATKLIDDLRRVQVQQADGSTAERSGTSIEPVQLQVVCYRLWENLPNDAAEIQGSDLREAGDVDSALAGYYAERVTAIAETSAVRERRIREWFDRQLITEQGIRGQVLRGPEQSQGLKNQAIAPLVDAHLVRAENRRGATWYELAHDRLIEPIRTDNAAWFQANLSTLQHQAALWEQQNRPAGLLLQDDALEDAERWAGNHNEELITTERDFLAACCEARAQAKKERFKNRFILGLAIVAVMISLVAMLQWWEAKRLRFVSIAQSLAAQAFQQKEAGQDEPGALLARQAYLFNERHQGNSLSQIDRALRALLDNPLFSHVLNFPEDAVSAAFSPDGQILALGNPDGTITLRKLNAPESPPLILQGHWDAVWSVAFSPNGKLLASGGQDRTVRLWDLQHPDSESVILRDHTGIVFSLSFAPDGQTLASGSMDCTLRLWNLKQPDVAPSILQGHRNGVTSVAFSPNGQTVASGSSDRTVRIWDIRNPAGEARVLRSHEGGVNSLAFSPDGRTLATGSADKTVRIWDLKNVKQAPQTLEGHAGDVYSLAFSPDGTVLVSGSQDHTTRLWDLHASEVSSLVLHKYEAPVLWGAFKPGGQNLISGSVDGTFIEYDFSTIQIATQIVESSARDVQALLVEQENHAVLSVGRDGTVLRWKFDPTGLSYEILLKDVGEMASAAFSSDGQFLALGRYDGVVRVWDLKAPDVTPVDLQGHTGTIRSVAFDLEGKSLASGSEDRTVRIWDMKNHDVDPLILTRNTLGPVFSVVFSLDGETLAVGSGSSGFTEREKDNKVRLWDLNKPNKRPKESLMQREPVSALVFSPDGRILASGGADAKVRIWDTGSLKMKLRPLQGHREAITSVIFSPDGRTLASAGNDDTIRLWDWHNQRTESVVWQGHKSSVTSLAFSPDGRHLVSGSANGRFVNWMLTDALADEVCRKVRRNLTEDEWKQFVGEDVTYERTCPGLQ